MGLWKRRRVAGKPSKHYQDHKEQARAFVRSRVAQLSLAHGFSYKRIAIRNTRRSWGSCSELGNLNFNYKIIFLPHELAEYIIVHELCHLRELNHSQTFWAHVASILPDYRERRRALRFVRTSTRLPHAQMPSGEAKGVVVQ